MDTLRVLHFDLTESTRFHPVDSPEPTSLAPWWTWLCQRYITCGTIQMLANQLNEAGPTIVLIHGTDVEPALQTGVADWLDRSSDHRVVIYTGFNWADVSQERMLRQFPRLNAALWHTRWTGIP